MAWRLRHSTPKIYTADATIEPTVVAENVMDISEKAARQQFAFYLQGWVDKDPENRHVQQKDGLNAWLLQRPADCDCVACTTWVRQSKADSGQEREWWWYGGRREHTTSYVKLKRLDRPVARATAPVWRVVDRAIQPDGQPEREHTLWSEHFTMAEASKGLVAAVRQWRNYGTKTASRRSDTSYTLKWAARPYSILSIERIPS